MQTILAALVGVQFRPASAKEIVDNLEIGQDLTLEHEPSNEYDINAVKVLDPQSGEFIGYIERSMNYEIAKHLEESSPYTCKVVSWLATRKPHLQIELLGDEEGHGEAA